MILTIFITFLIVFVAVCGDDLLSKTDYFIYKALIDTITHGSIGLFSWAVVVFNNPIRNYKFNHGIEILICGCIASLIDLDHFIAARSFKLKDALHLSKRAPFHSSSLLILVFLTAHILAKVFKSTWLYRLSWIILVAGGSHHIRDGVRRGLWFPPVGSTPPLHQVAYLGSLALLPHLLDTIQLEVYWFSCGLLILIVTLFILVIILFIKLTRLKNEMRRKVKEVHKFNVPYIDPKEDLAKRGFAQYPQRSIALQH